MCHVARLDVYVLDNNNNRLQAFQLIGLTRYLLGVCLNPSLVSVCA